MEHFKEIYEFVLKLVVGGVPTIEQKLHAADIATKILLAEKGIICEQCKN